MLYVDSSALAKRYISESSTELARALLDADLDWVSAQHTYVEVALALGRRVGRSDIERARSMLDRDWRRIAVVAIDDHLVRAAADIGLQTGMRTLDALHLAAAQRVGGRAIPIVTFDRKLADAARAVGFNVLGS